LSGDDDVTVARFANFSYWYPGSATAALDRVDIAIEGGIVALTGASGSGKSTALRVFNGLVPHFHGGTVRGRACVLGLDVLSHPTRELARDVGFLFQDPELQAVYATVDRDVAFGLENLGVPRPAMLGRVHDALERAGIGALAGRAVSTLSGGERQRLALAGVLALEPRVLVLDEPLSQLDAGGAVSLMQTICEIAAGGATVVIAEHRLEHVLSRADRVLHIDRGRIGATAASPPNVAPYPVERSSIATSDAGRWSLRDVTAGVAGTAVVADVDLAGGGDVVVLMGPNGSGKTTLLRTLAGLLPPLSGIVERPQGRVAYLPQNPTSLLHRATVRSEIEWTLRRSPGGGNGDVDAALRAFGLQHVADRYPRDLSTGERQRAALGAVLVGRPALALLDEPTRGMDAAARQALVNTIRQVRAGGGSVVMATHDHDLATAVADRIVQVNAGTVRDAPVPEHVLA
jgi:energy-coupling factor transport system ATP-binding protein